MRSCPLQLLLWAHCRQSRRRDAGKSTRFFRSWQSSRHKLDRGQFPAFLNDSLAEFDGDKTQLLAQNRP